jgi:hypothetical protein
MSLADIIELIRTIIIILQPLGTKLARSNSDLTSEYVYLSDNV